MATHSGTGGRRRKRGAGEDDQPLADVNMIAAGLLHDMAALQPNERSQLGYKRAAKAVIALPLTVGDLVAAGTLRDVPYIGPSSARVITELVETGASSAVDAAVAGSRQADKVASLRQLRTNFLSQVTMEQALHYGLARQALEAGCIFALDSDAHSIGELRFTDYSIAHARIAGIPAERVINCWSDERLGEWMRERRG